MASSDQDMVIEAIQKLSSPVISPTLKEVIHHKLETCFNLEYHKYEPFPFTFKRAKIRCINGLSLDPTKNEDTFLWRDKWITQRSNHLGTDYNLPDRNSYDRQDHFIDMLLCVIKGEVGDNGWRYFDLGCTDGGNVVCVLFNIMVTGKFFETNPIDIVLNEDGKFDTRWIQLKIPEFTTIQPLEDVFNLPCYGRSSVCDGNVYGYLKFAMIIRFAKSIDLYPKELYEVDQKWLRFDTVIKVVSKITSFEFLRYLADNNEKKLFNGTVKDCHRAFDRKDIKSS